MYVLCSKRAVETSNTVEEYRVNLQDSIDLYNYKEYPANSSNYCFISQVSKSKIKEIQDNRILYTHIMNNHHKKSPNNTNALLGNKIGRALVSVGSTG